MPRRTPSLLSTKGPQLDPRKAKSGLDHAIANGWLVLHESGTFVRHASEHRSFCITSAHPRRAALFVNRKCCDDSGRAAARLGSRAPCLPPTPGHERSAVSARRAQPHWQKGGLLASGIQRARRRNLHNVAAAQRRVAELQLEYSWVTAGYQPLLPVAHITPPATNITLAMNEESRLQQPLRKVRIDRDPARRSGDYS
jgi:hypothetical protein